MDTRLSGNDIAAQMKAIQADAAARIAQLQAQLEPANDRHVKFSKEWLLKLANGPAPTKMVEYQDIHPDAPSESGTNFLRARHFPTGGVKLSVVRTPPGSRAAKRVTLKKHPVGKNFKLPAMHKDAIRVAQEIADGINPNAKPVVEAPSESLTLARAFKLYLEGTENLKEGTIKNMHNHVNVHMKSLLDAELASLVSADKILKVKKIAQKSCAQQPRAGSGASGANNVLRTLRRLVKYHRALDVKGEIPEWPAERLKALGNVWHKDKPRTRRLKNEQFPDYMAALNKEPEQARDYHTMLMLCGGRKAEILKLTNGDIDLRAKTFVFLDPKNGYDHTLPITETIGEIFARRRAAVGFAKDAKLFCLDPRTTTNRIEKATTTDEMPGIKLSPHDYRRTFAGVARLCGIPRDRISALTNHRSGLIVTDDYAGEFEIDQLRDDMIAIEAKMNVLANPPAAQEASDS